MHRYRLFAPFLVVLFLGGAAADLRNEPADTRRLSSPQQNYQQAIHNSAQEYLRTVRQARTRYLESLDLAMREATRAGDLDRALALRAEKHKQRRDQNVIPNPIAVVAPKERAEQRLRVEPTPAIPLTTDTLTARAWYVFHRTGKGRPEKVIKLEPGGAVRFLEGAQSTDWDEKKPTWKYEHGHLVLTGKSGVLARFEAINAVIVRSREEDPHRFFWIQPDIADPFRPAPAVGNR